MPKKLKNDEKFDEGFWRERIDPCRLRMTAFQFREPELYEARWCENRDEMRAVVSQESKAFSSELSKVNNFTEAGRYNLFREVMERDAWSLGFLYDKSKSSRTFPVFSKQISDEWDLSWSIEDPKQFFYTFFRRIYDTTFDP